MMGIFELTRVQLIELKQAMLFARLDKVGRCPSYGEIADVDNDISDAAVYEEYADTIFSMDDFFCTAGM